MLLSKKNYNEGIKIFYIITLFLFSTLFNQYYGNLGVCPIDSFAYFNSAYDVINGHYPFKDYWTITGPFLTLTQVFFFKIFGISWFSYVLHASIINFFLSISTFFILFKFKLNIHYSFLYALMVAILAYPSAGSPYVDHQSAIFSIISIYCFILALKTNLKTYWFLLPIILCLSFLTKQAPTGYVFIIIITLCIIHFIFNFNIKNIFYGLLGSLTIISTFLIILAIGKIPLINFFQQYILFPISLGESRYEHFLFPLEFNRLVLRHKLIHLSSLVLIVASFISIKKDFKYLKNNEFLITLALLGTSYAFIIHQLLTINGMFIFFIIPILVGFSHSYYLKYFKSKKYILYLLLLLSISSTSYYGYKYIHKRDFMDLRKVNMNQAIDANLLDNKFNGLKWKSCLFYSKDSSNEVSELLKIMNIIKNDNRKKSIITDYQFISVILSIYDFSPSQVWYGYHVNPQKGSKYFKIYKNFVTNFLILNKIEIIYLVKPLWGGDNIIEEVLDQNCIKKTEINNKLDLYTLLECGDLKS